MIGELSDQLTLAAARERDRSLLGATESSGMVVGHHATLAGDRVDQVAVDQAEQRLEALKRSDPWPIGGKVAFFWSLLLVSLAIVAWLPPLAGWVLAVSAAMLVVRRAAG